jgi:predicted transcriptional regulator
VTLDDDLYTALLAYATAQDRTPANVVKHALRGYLSRFHAIGGNDRLRVRAKASEGQESEGKEAQAT